MQKKLAFNSGVLKVLNSVDHVIVSEKDISIRFEENTIGMSRFFQAQTSGTTVDRVISIPENMHVERDNLVELTDFRTGVKQVYEVKLIQIKFDTLPVSMMLTLTKGGVDYVDNRSVE